MSGAKEYSAVAAQSRGPGDRCEGEEGSGQVQVL